MLTLIGPALNQLLTAAHPLRYSCKLSGWTHQINAHTQQQMCCLVCSVCSLCVFWRVGFMSPIAPLLASALSAVLTGLTCNALQHVVQMLCSPRAGVAAAC